MKKIFSTALFALAAMMFVACDKDTEGLTGITYYPVITLEGDDPMYIEKGESFVEPGYTAMEGTDDVTENVSISITDASGENVSAVSTSSANLYTITYSATNVDGFSASVSRSVFVYDPDVTETLEGTYNVDMDNTYYVATGRTFAEYAASYGYTTQCTGIVFTEVATGIYYCNDLFGHWYNEIRGYGASYGTRYDMTGYVLLNADNSISLLTSYVTGWGDGLDYITDGVYDPDSGTISYFLSYAEAIYIDLVLIRQ